MKIAMLFGKGLDGCGVQRGGVEFQQWAIRNKVKFDIYSLVERKFHRASGHDMEEEVINFTPDQMCDIANILNDEYDIVIINSYPSHKHKPTTSISFYYNLMLNLTKPIVVGMMHEIKQMNIDCYPLILPILNQCDIVYNFSEKTWFSRNLPNVLPSKQLGDRMRRFKLWSNIDNLKAKYYDRVALADKARRLTYVGRWTTMKDPRRVLDLSRIFKKRDRSFELLIHGIERSIGAKVDILDDPATKYQHNFKGEYNFCPEYVQVFGPYTHDEGMKYITNSLFAASFFQLPKEPYNYGDRMEYTQIEIIACGSIPVFDAHYGNNNIDSFGQKYSENDHLAVWSDRNNLENTAEQLISVSHSTVEQDKYRESGMEFIKREFDVNKVLPAMIDEILALGKDNNKFSDITDYMMNFYGEMEGPSKLWNELILADTCPAVGFKQFETKQFCKFVGKGRVEIADFSSKKKKKELVNDLSNYF